MSYRDDIRKPFVNIKIISSYKFAKRYPEYLAAV